MAVAVAGDPVGYTNQDIIAVDTSVLLLPSFARQNIISALLNCSMLFSVILLR